MNQLVWSVVFVLAYKSLLSAAQYELNWTYVSESGEDQAPCIHGGVNHPCRTLGYASCRNCTTPQQIKILDSQLELDHLTRFSGARNVMLAGRSEEKSELRCTCAHSDCGLVFEDCGDISILWLTITGCGVVVDAQRSNNRSSSFKAAIAILNCHHFTLNSSNISSNTETGLAIKDTSGNVTIQNSFFQRNGMCSDCHQGRGLWIQFTSHSSKQSCNLSYYVIELCQFEDNYSLLNDKDYYEDTKSGGGMSITFHGNCYYEDTKSGGGMSIGNCSRSEVHIRHTSITGNIATWGGGLFIHFSEMCRNRIRIYDVLFFNNSATKAGGGMDIGYTDQASRPPILNNVLVENCNFTENNARSGGGTAIFSSQTDCAKGSDHNNSALVFKDSLWERNTASFSPAVDVSPYDYDTMGSLYLPHPKFTSCTFIANKYRKANRLQTKLVNAGCFSVNVLEVQFDGHILFKDHHCSAVHVTEGAVSFLPGTRAVFEMNTGTQGGALSLHGSSPLFVFPNATLHFFNNTALDVGGAIFHSTNNHHDFITSRTCFIRTVSSAQDQDSKPVLNFHRNRAYQTGHSIFASTFMPCYFEHFTTSPWGEHSVYEVLQKIAQFNFHDTKEAALATPGVEFVFNGTMPLPVIPGRRVSIPLTMTDELNHTAPSVYRVNVEDASRSAMTTDRLYTLGHIGVNGSEDASGNISLSLVSFRASSFQVEISLQKCPPGFYFNASYSSCQCSAQSEKHSYSGIYACHDTWPRAYIRKGFWVGYDNNQSLITAPCPLSFCAMLFHSSSQIHLLPKVSSPDTLEHFICHKHRRDWLCGKCHHNLTTYYHSPIYKCGSKHLCHLSFLFYILSELLPIAIIFLIIVVWDINFTSGSANGLVFFAQVIDTVSLTTKGNVQTSKPIERLTSTSRVIYGLFNFDFFSIEPLSFCLWKDATVLDVITFKYVSVVFAFGLLLLLAAILRHCSFKHVVSKKKKMGISWSMIHGISAVLIMCYAQCTEISFLILSKATLRGAGMKKVHDVTFFGGNHYMGTEHLLYALPAYICIFTIIVPPPLLLVVYPAYMKVLSLCRLNETKPLFFISKFFTKLKPILDSFQGCYKDNFRFFSGLYFVIRVVILAASAFLSSIQQSILIIEIIVLLMLGAHAITQPFQRKEDNISNGLILLNIALINSMTLFIYIQTPYYEQEQAVIATLWMRLILMYLPIACICVHMVTVGVKKTLRRLRKKNNTALEMEVMHEDIPDRIVDHDYLSFQELDSPRETLLTEAATY